jgi:hypothetical protein
MRKRKPLKFHSLWIPAIFEGKKTQTRRPIIPQPESVEALYPNDESHMEFWNLIEEPSARASWCPYGKPGDLLEDLPGLKLKITGLRVEQMYDISEQDLKAEGMEGETCGMRAAFHELWNAFYKSQPDFHWENNPWVWVIEFKKIDR